MEQSLFFAPGTVRDPSSLCGFSRALSAASFRWSVEYVSIPPSADQQVPHETKYPGKKFEDLATRTRKKYFYEAQHAYTERTGNPPYRQVPGNMTFAEYFEQMPEKEKERYLGPGRYEVWKNGNLPLTKFFPPYPERMYSVKELKEMDKKALKREPVTFDFMKSEDSDDITTTFKSFEYDVTSKKDAIEFLKSHVAKDAETTGLDLKTINVINTLFFEKMKKYGIPRFKKIMPGDGIFGISRDNTMLAFNNELVDAINNPRQFFRKHVSNYVKSRGRKYFAIDNKDQVIQHLIDHEIGHGVFNKSLLVGKKEKLWDLWIKYRDDEVFGLYAYNDFMDFFGEAFAIYSRGGILNDEIIYFIGEILA